VIPIAIGNAQKESLSQYDKEKYREMILDASETVLGLFGFDRTVYSQFKKKEIGKWYDELRAKGTNKQLCCFLFSCCVLYSSKRQNLQLSYWSS
jgi:hypothetical protein